MSRKPKYSKELKIDTAKRYLNGEGSYISLSKEIGADSSIIYGRILKYKKYGDEAFDTSTTNTPYTKEFKEKVAKIAELAVGDACTGSNPRAIDPANMEKLLTCTYYGTEVDF